MPYILITSDQSSINEKIVAAIDIVKFRLGEGQWPLYKATPFLYDLKKEDKCLVYLAGKNQFSQHFVGHFEILEVRQSQNPDKEENKLGILTQKPVREIIFKPTLIMQPVSVRELLKHLDHTSKVTDKTWGAKFMGGVRRISNNDFDLIKQKLNNKN